MAREQTILVVDDDPRIRRFVRTELESEGYRVLTADSGAQAPDILESEAVHLVVLDVLMPELDGFETLGRIRQVSAVPVILLSARGANRDQVLGLNLGTDDYITKPFNPEELTARIRAVFRRGRPSLGHPGRPLSLGALSLDLDQRRVQVGDRDVSLSSTEWHRLYHLASNAGRVIPHEDLLSMV